MNRRTRFVKDVLIMTAVSLFMRTVAVSFNSYISARVGAEGMGLYTLVTSVYAFAITFATSGINLGVTRTVAEAMASGRSVKKELGSAILYALFFGTLALCVMFFGAEFIGTRLLCDARTVKSIRVFAVSLPFIALSSTFNGYFCAVRKTWKNAAAMLFEQAGKIYLCASLLTVFMPRGIEYACLSLVLGGALAESASVLFAWLFYMLDKSRKINADKSSAGIKNLSAVAFPVALSAYFRSALVSVEHMLIPRGLKKHGFSHEAALARYGILQGMALPVVLFPAAFSTAFSGLLVPEMAQCAVEGDKNRLKRLTENAIYTILIFAVCACGILISEAYTIADVLYKGTNAGYYIRALAVVVPVMYCDTVCDGILKGIGEQVFAMKVNIVDASLSTLLVYLLLPKYEIGGYVFVIILCEVINASLSLWRVLEKTSARIDPLRALLPPALAIFLSTRTVHALSLRLVPLSAGAELVFRICACVILYALVLSAFSLVGKVLEKIKGGKKILVKRGEM